MLTGTLIFIIAILTVISMTQAALLKEKRAEIRALKRQSKHKSCTQADLIRDGFYD